MHAPPFALHGHAHVCVKHLVIDDKSDHATGNVALIQHRVNPDRVRPIAVAAERPFAHCVARAPGTPGDYGSDPARKIIFVDLIIQFAQIMKLACGPRQDPVRLFFGELLSVRAHKCAEERHPVSSVFQKQTELIDHVAVRVQEHPVQPDAKNPVANSRREHACGIVRERERDRPAQDRLDPLLK